MLDLKEVANAVEYSLESVAQCEKIAGSHSLAVAMTIEILLGPSLMSNKEAEKAALYIQRASSIYEMLIEKEQREEDELDDDAAGNEGVSSTTKRPGYIPYVGLMKLSKQLCDVYLGLGKFEIAEKIAVDVLKTQLAWKRRFEKRAAIATGENDDANGAKASTFISNVTYSGQLSHMLGVARLKMGQIEPARLAFEASLQANEARFGPANTAAHETLGCLLHIYRPRFGDQDPRTKALLSRLVRVRQIIQSAQQNNRNRMEQAQQNK